jgi:hypothetical protein
VRNDLLIRAALIALGLSPLSCENGPGQYMSVGDIELTVRAGDTCKPMDEYRILVDGDFFMPFPDTLGVATFNVRRGPHEITVRDLRPDPIKFWSWTTTIDAQADTVLVVPCHVY